MDRWDGSIKLTSLALLNFLCSHDSTHQRKMNQCMICIQFALQQWFAAGAEAAAKVADVVYGEWFERMKETPKETMPANWWQGVGAKDAALEISSRIRALTGSGTGEGE